MFDFDKRTRSLITHGEPSSEREAKITPYARRRWKIVVSLLTLVGVGAWSSGSVNPRAIAAVLKDPLSLFAARSPGERAAGALTQTKPARGSGPQVRRVIPRERVLSGGRSRPVGPAEPGGSGVPGTIVDSGLAPGVLPDDDILIGDPGSGGSAFSGGGGGGAPFFVPPTSNGPGIGGPGGNPGDGTVNPPTSPVPEPDTWLTMMVGLVMIGAALRRRRAAAVSGGYKLSREEAGTPAGA